MTRMYYFFATILVGIMFTLTLINNTNAQSIQILGLFIVLFQLFVVGYRMLDVGMSRWWLIGIFIPIVCFYPSFICGFAPTGYKIKNHENYGKTDGWYTFGFALYGLGIITYLIVLAGA